MGFLFGSKPKRAEPPPVPAPVAIPEVGAETEDWAMRAAKRKRGFMSTIITGALQPASRKRTVLG